MRGLELAKTYYETYGAPMLARDFPQLVSRVAVGLVGEGSECLGFDDELSQDHDFEPGFCLFLTDDDAREYGFALERAYAKLPREYMGYRRAALSPAGGARHGVMRVGDFYRKFLGAPNAPDSAERWLYTPPAALAAASSGEVFRDDLGAFSAVRAVLRAGYPEDIRRKKLAAHLALMAQAGEYNYERCVARGERGAAQLAVFEFVKNAISAVFLLERVYEPFYKWAYRAMRDLPRLAALEAPLVLLGEGENDENGAKKKVDLIKEVVAVLGHTLVEEGMSRTACDSLSADAFAVQNSIKDPTLRNMHVMDGV